jgi:ATP-dependent DNA helicase DinG
MPFQENLYRLEVTLMSTTILTLPQDYPKLDRESLASQYNESIKPFFAHENERTHFKEICSTIVNALIEDYDNVWVEVPCGVGKSSIVKTLGEYLISTKSISNYFVMTPKIGLMQQYENEKGVHLDALKGRSNFKCSRGICDFCPIPPLETSCRPPRHMCSADEAPCMDAHFKCPIKTRAAKAYQEHHSAITTECEYINQYYRAAVSPRVLSNPAYIFRVQQGRSIFDARSLAFYDEAHNLPDTIQSMSSKAITLKDWKLIYEVDGLMNPFPSTPLPIETWKSTVEEMFKITTDRLAVMGENKSDEDAESSVPPIDLETATPEEVEEYRERMSLVKRLTELEEKLTLMKTMIASCPFIVQIEYSDIQKLPSAVFTPVIIAPMASLILNSASRQKIFLSGTFRNSAYWTNILGQSNLKNLFIFCEESPTPVENRPIHILPIGSMSYSKREQNMPPMLALIDKIIDKHAGQKGLILPFSYSMSESIQKGISNQLRLISHAQDKNSRDTAISKFMDDSRSDAVIISPYLSEGFDGKDSLCRFIVMPKMPYPSLMDPIIQERIKITQRHHSAKYHCLVSLKDGICNSFSCDQGCMRWYKLQTAITLTQMLGRLIRHENDWGSAYILDSSFLKFYSGFKHMLPAYVQQAIIIHTPKPSPSKEIPVQSQIVKV